MEEIKTCGNCTFNDLCGYAEKNVACKDFILDPIKRLIKKMTAKQKVVKVLQEYAIKNKGNSEEYDKFLLDIFKSECYTIADILINAGLIKD